MTKNVKQDEVNISKAKGRPVLRMIGGSKQLRTMEATIEQRLEMMDLFTIRWCIT